MSRGTSQGCIWGSWPRGAHQSEGRCGEEEEEEAALQARMGKGFGDGAQGGQSQAHVRQGGLRQVRLVQACNSCQASHSLALHPSRCVRPPLCQALSYVTPMGPGRSSRCILFKPARLPGLPLPRPAATDWHALQARERALSAKQCLVCLSLTKCFQAGLLLARHKVMFARGRHLHALHKLKTARGQRSPGGRDCLPVTSASTCVAAVQQANAGNPLQDTISYL